MALSESVMKKRLTQDARRRVFLNLVPVFRDPQLVERLKAAEEAFKVSLIAAARAIPADEIAVMKRYGLTRKLFAVEIPGSLTVRAGMKEFSFGDKTVKRPVTRHVSYHPGSPSFFNVTMADIARYDAEHFQRCFIKTRRLVVATEDSAPDIPSNGDLSLSVRLAAVAKKGHYEVLEPEGAAAKEWVSKEALDALRDMMIASQDEMEAHVKLMMAMRNVIVASKTAGDLVKALPEAEEPLRAFYNDSVSVGAVLALSDEDKALLCSNMKARKANGPSAICGAQEAA